MEIKINIDDIDYEALADRMMPLLISQLSNDREDVATRLMLLSQGFTESAVKMILSKMPKEKKDQLLVRLINKNKPQIMELIGEMALSQGIRLNVNDVEAKI